MEDQEKLDFIKKCQNDPVGFVEEFYPGLKLHNWQKAILIAMNTKDKLYKHFCTPYRNGRDILMKGQLEYMKSMEMDFNIITKDGIEVYEKGILVRTIKN